MKGKTNRMNTKILILALALGASTCLLTAQDDTQRPEGQRPPGREAGQAGPRGGFHLLPPRASEQLKLTADQQQQVAALEAETKAKLEKILTPEQLEQLKQIRKQQRPGGPGGQGGQKHRGGPDGQAAPNGEGRPHEPAPE